MAMVDRGGDGKKRSAAEMSEPSYEKIILTIQAQDGTHVTYRVPREAPLKKLLWCYCEEKNLEFLAMRFVYEGKRVQNGRTPDELCMADGDQIDAFVEASGGGPATI